MTLLRGTRDQKVKPAIAKVGADDLIARPQ